MFTSDCLLKVGNSMKTYSDLEMQMQESLILPRTTGVTPGWPGSVTMKAAGNWLQSRQDHHQLSRTRSVYARHRALDSVGSCYTEDSSISSIPGLFR